MTAAAFWDKIAEKYSKDPIRNVDAYQASLARTKHWLTPDMRVLELGCGTGSTALLLKDDAAEILGTDFSTEMVRIGNAKVADEGATNVRFEVADAGRAAQGQVFDAVMAFNLIHLASNPNAVFDHARSLLPEGGLFISKTPCLGGKWFFKPLIAVLNLIGKAPGKVHFLHSYDLHRLAEQNGFEIVETGQYPPGGVMSYYIVAKAV